MALSHSHYCRFFIVWLAPRFFIGCRWASVQLFETNGSMDDMQIFIGRILRFLLFVCLFSNLYFEVGRFTGWHHLFAVGIFWSGLSDVYRGIFFFRVSFKFGKHKRVQLLAFGWMKLGASCSYSWRQKSKEADFLCSAPRRNGMRGHVINPMIHTFFHRPSP